MTEDKNQATNSPAKEMRLDDEKRVQVLSPSMLVFKRFIRNQLAIVGLIILVLMFLFSFVGGLISPYGQTEVFRKYDLIPKEYASAIENTDLRYIIAQGEKLPNAAIAQFVLAQGKGKNTFSSGGKNYFYEKMADDFFEIFELKPLGNILLLGKKGNFSYETGVQPLDKEAETAIINAIKAKQTEIEVGEQTYTLKQKGKTYEIATTSPIAVATKKIFDAFAPEARKMLNSLPFVLSVEKAILAGNDHFDVAGTDYRIELDDNASTIYKLSDGQEVPFSSISTLIVKAFSPDVFLTVDFKAALAEALSEKATTFTAKLSDGTETEFSISRTLNTHKISMMQRSLLIDLYARPSATHWLGTDANGMDVITRLMYGGRISLMVGFIVVFLELLIGVIIGGVAGFFGGAIDTALMRFIDLFNSIPFWPIMIISGSVMDIMEVKPINRIFVLMAVLGILGWTGIARVVRGQILSLREQDFMVATEATGIRISRRIFKHLVPNVMPLLIVQSTLALGGIIITEATLSFLGLGIKYPFASWGSIINAATNLYVMTNYWFIWIPAGFLILFTVLGFNFVGDGLRDAFDPKMKR